MDIKYKGIISTRIGGNGEKSDTVTQKTDLLHIYGGKLILKTHIQGTEV